VTGVTSRNGDPLTPGGPTTLSTAPEAIRGIDDLQAHAASLLGQVVTVTGEVYIRASSSGTAAPSAFLEDGTGRGVNVLGVLGGAIPPELDTLGAVIQVTGTVAQSFTTVQLTSVTATALAWHTPELAPEVLTIPQASAPDWEGTYIQTTGVLAAPPSAYGANDYRYSVTGSGTVFTFRVRNAAGVDPSAFGTGDTVTAAGAGGAYPFPYQLTVGSPGQTVRGSGLPDLVSPTLFSASAAAASDSLLVTFSEPVGVGAASPSRYTVFPTADPASPLAVTTATVSGATVTLVTANSFTSGVPYTVQVNGVQDLSGNPIAANAALAFTPAIPDLTPPALVSAAGTGGQTGVTVVFSEPVFAGASVASNYEVFPNANPGAPISVSAAAPAVDTVRLVLAAPLAAGLDYTVRVHGIQDFAGNTVVANSAVSFTATVPTGFVVTGAFQFGKEYVGVGFSETVDVASATDPSHYAFTPPLSIASIVIQDNGRTAILRTTSPLPAASLYSLAVSGVTGATGDPLAAAGPTTFQTVSGAVTDIADIQANVSAYKRQAVVIVGQVFIPVGSRGGTPSGYLQDGSGHGINLFGGSAQSAVNALGNVARVSGIVDTFNTTTELTGYSATLLASGQPHLGARALTARQANSVAWEGTYIQTTATLTGPPTASGSSNTNYNAADGGSAITFRVGNGLGIDPTGFTAGDRITGRGAGGSFQSTFQINVGNAADLVKVQGGPTSSAATRLIVPAATLIKNLGTLSFQIAGPSGAHAVCRIYNLQGRMVRVLFDGKLYGTETLTWDGRDDTFEFVPAGMYVCHLQTADMRGSVSEDHAPIVVAVRLR
jgi:hypothetical protein